jgi:histidine ammonia-lyase
MTEQPPLELTPNRNVSLDDLTSVIRDDRRVTLPASPEWRRKMEEAAAFVRETWTNKREIYG